MYFFKLRGICIDRLTNELNSKSKKLFIFSGMIKSQWMFSLRKANNLINRIHERSILIAGGHDGSNLLQKIMKQQFAKETCKY